VQGEAHASAVLRRDGETLGAEGWARWHQDGVLTALLPVVPGHTRGCRVEC